MPVRGMVMMLLAVVGSGFNAENDERLIGAAVLVLETDAVALPVAVAEGVTFSEAAELVVEALTVPEPVAEAETEAVEETAATKLLDGLTLALAVSTGALAETLLLLLLLGRGALIWVCTGAAPPNASAGTRMVIVFHSSSSSAVSSPLLLSLTLGRPAIEVGTAFEGTVTVIVRSPVTAAGAAVAVDAGLASEVGTTVTADAAAASRLGTAGTETEGTEAGGDTEGTAAGVETDGTGGTALAGAETEGTAEGASVGSADVGRPDVGTALPTGLDDTAATAGTLGTATLLDGLGAGGEL